MNINIYLTPESIKNAIKVLNKQKEILQKNIIPEFLELSVQWIRDKANENLQKSDIGKKVKSWIQHSWYIKSEQNRVILYNTSWKSAFVEFGVGIVGQATAHPNASSTDWIYNIETEHKDASGGWIFPIDEEDKLDLPENAIVESTELDDGLLIYTRGTKGVWYLFNAVEDYKLNRQKSLWQEVKERYW